MVNIMKYDYYWQNAKYTTYAYKQYIDAFERLLVFWIIVNIMKYDYYCQNAKHTTLNKAIICHEIDFKRSDYLEYSMRHMNHN